MKSHREWGDFGFSDAEMLERLRAADPLEPGPARAGVLRGLRRARGQASLGREDAALCAEDAADPARTARGALRPRDPRRARRRALGPRPHGPRGRRRGRGRAPLAAQDRPRPRGRPQARPLPGGPLRGPGRRPPAGPRGASASSSSSPSTRRCSTTTSARSRASTRCGASCPRASGSAQLSVDRRMADPPPHDARPRLEPCLALAGGDERGRPRRLRARRRRRPSPSSAIRRRGPNRSFGRAALVAFLICVEAGQLEPQGILFAELAAALRRALRELPDPRLCAARGP